MILEHFYLQQKTGHNRGPPQQTYYLGSIFLMKPMKNNKQKNCKNGNNI